MDARAVIDLYGADGNNVSTLPAQALMPPPIPAPAQDVHFYRIYLPRYRLRHGGTAQYKIGKSEAAAPGLMYVPLSTSIEVCKANPGWTENPVGTSLLRPHVASRVAGSADDHMDIFAKTFGTMMHGARRSVLDRGCFDSNRGS